MRTIVKILTVGLPLVHWTLQAADHMTRDAMQDALNGSREFLRAFSETRNDLGGDTGGGIGPGDRQQRAYGEQLVALGGLLEEIAPPERDRWGGLSKVLIGKTNYCWLCAEHVSQYIAKECL